jgi:hypothetical protein
MRVGSAMRVGNVVSIVYGAWCMSMVYECGV